MRSKLAVIFVILLVSASLSVTGCTNPLTSTSQNDDQRFADFLTQKYGSGGNTTITAFSKQHDSDLNRDFFVGAYKDVNGTTTNVKLGTAQDKADAQQTFKSLVQYYRTHGYPTNFIENETVWASITSLFPFAGAVAMWNATPDEYKPYTSAPYVVAGMTFSSLSSGTQTVSTPTPSSKKNVNVTAQYQGVYTPTGQYVSTPKPGYQYVKFYVTVRNVNDSGRDIGSPYYFKLFDSLNEGHTTTYVSGIGDQLVTKSKSVPGDKVSGSIVFEIKQNAKPKQLVYDDYYNSVTINL
jgi:Domain of unknown function (DUF4352)